MGHGCERGVVTRQSARGAPTRARKYISASSRGLLLILRVSKDLGFPTNHWAGPSVPGRIACRERLFRRFIDHSFFRLANVFFGLEPIVHGRTWSVTTPPIEFLSTQADPLLVGKEFHTALSCIGCWHLFTSTLLDGVLGRSVQAKSRYQVANYCITGRVNRWAGAHTCCMLAKDFEVGDWVNVNGEGDTLCKVWSSIAGTAFIVPLKRPSTEGWYVGVGDLTDRNALRNVSRSD